METWFECKAKYSKVCADGKERVVSETYLVDAVSFSEAEERINKELEPYISGEFFVVVIKIANFSEVIPSDVSDKWFKCKVSFISLDEEKGVEKKSSTNILVQADNAKQAYDNIETVFADSVTDYEIPSIQESPILDVFKFNLNGEE